MRLVVDVVTVPGGANESDGANVRLANVARCAVALRDDGEATVAAIARGTGLSRPTVEAAVLGLAERGIVRAVDGLTTGGRGAGRPARRYAFDNASGFLVGVDVGPHKVSVAIADLAGRVIGWADEPVDDSFIGPGRMEGVKQIIHRALADASVPVQTIVAMGVAVPGLVGENGRLIGSRNLPDWEGVDIAGHLHAEFACVVRVENDMRLAALAEHRLGAARLADDVVYLFAGHRVSMGLIIGGKVRRGHHSAAGEVGDIVFSKHVNSLGELQWTSASSAEEVFRQAAEGEVESRREVERFVAGLSVGLAIVAMAIDPDLVVIGGGLSRAGDVLLDPLRTAVNAEITVPVRPAIVASELGAESVVLGALARACSESTSIVFGVSGVREPAIDLTHVRGLGEELVEAS